MLLVQKNAIAAAIKVANRRLYAALQILFFLLSVVINVLFVRRDLKKAFCYTPLSVVWRLY
jgi:hypothetical protein